jgi:uncharacterized protein
VTKLTDRHGLEVLPLNQCLSLLRSRPLGRLAYVRQRAPGRGPRQPPRRRRDRGPAHRGGGKLDAALAGEPVAFQLDDHDPAAGTGWSVLVQGRAEIVDDPELLARYEDKLDSWAIGDGTEVSWLRIMPDEVSGRRLRRSS